MITLKKIIPVGLLCTGLIMTITHSYAECHVSTSGNVSIGKVPSISMTESGIQSSQFNAGLNCQSLLTIFTTSYIKYKIVEIPKNYINSVTGEQLTVSYLDTSDKPLSDGSERELGGFSIIDIFSGPGGSLEFKAKVDLGQSVSPGIYRAESLFKLKWYYYVPGLGLGPFASYYQSPGFTLGWFGGVSSWGDGRDASLSLSVEVLPDCRVVTRDVNFGTAAFATAFEPVQTSMGIRCSVKTPYKVGLNNGLYPQSGNQRAMKTSSGNNFLRYEIYKNTTSERWGSNGSEQWLSTNATTNAGVYDAKTQQGYTFTTKILENNPDNLPAGVYSDTITVQVEF